jgi:hypothetical protein
MFVKNVTNKDIAFRSFNGYKFLIPPGVSWIWGPAGDWLLTKIYVTTPTPPTDKFGNPNGNGVQPLQKSTKDAWVKGGKRLAQVERFKINYTQIPKKEQMLDIARERGIPQDEVMRFMLDKNIDRSEIAEAINNLPVPEDIRFPKEIEEPVPATT